VGWGQACTLSKVRVVQALCRRFVACRSRSVSC
jgi:hypothetical protein